jgi:hypothetical protein
MDTNKWDPTRGALPSRGRGTIIFPVLPTSAVFEDNLQLV